MAKTFYSWLMQFKDDNTAIGDLSRDARRDPGFPRRSISYRNLKDHLESRQACADAINTFSDAFVRYKAAKAMLKGSGHIDGVGVVK